MAKKSSKDKMGDCFEPHVLLHSVAGLGIGMVLVGWVPSLLPYAAVLGIILVLAALIIDYLR